MFPKITFLFLFFVASAEAQQKYWIFFKDKDLNQKPAISEKTIYQRKVVGLAVSQFSDLPLNDSYIKVLQKSGIKINQKSKWFNAVSAKLTSTDLLLLEKFDFVHHLETMQTKLICTKIKQKQDYKTDFALEQVGGSYFREQNLTGKGIEIGMIDAGYFGADEGLALKHVIKKQVLGIRDFVNPEKVFHYSELETDMDTHGTEVLGSIAGIDSLHQIQYGLATDARFYLTRTDHGTREFRGEEDNWVAAIEWLDSLGVRLVNTSLGYAKGFTNPKENYNPKQMDGKTSLISRAAQMASDEKGILVVVSAGNEGDDESWKVVSTPADAAGVLAIGATDEYGLKMNYSSIGPDFLPYQKPNIACYSLMGTSLAAPIITGFAACLWQTNPNLSNKEIKNAIEKSGHLYPNGNNFVGYGVPNAKRAVQIIKQESENINTEIVCKTNTCTINVETNEPFNIFRKKDSINVIRQKLAKGQNGFYSLQRSKNEHQTTIELENKVIEVFWK